MILYLFAAVASLVVMIWSTDRFLTGAANSAKQLGVSPLLIGLTIVSLGTSAPEIVVAVVAAFNDTPNLAIGNALGSNIANIGMVLGITALFRPLPFPSSVLKSEMVWLIAAVVLALILLADSHFSRVDGLLLLSGLALLLWNIARQQKKGKKKVEPEELKNSDKIFDKTNIWLFISGLVLLLLSAELLVWSATLIAAELGVSDLIIGLTIIAIGTSLPELFTTLGSALKGQPGLAIGNVVGSNILNLLAVLAIPGLITPTDLLPETMPRDFFAMAALTMLLVLFAYGFSSKPSITRFEGCILAAAWIAYNALLFHQLSHPMSP